MGRRRFVSYFTIQSNVLVAVTAVQLARDPRDGRWWRPVRVDLGRRRGQRLVPLPFLDVGAEGVASVARTCLGVTVLFVLLVAGVSMLDRRMPSAPVRDPAPAPSGDVVTAE